jgi:hypothetical protein
LGKRDDRGIEGDQTDPASSSEREYVGVGHLAVAVKLRDVGVDD